MIKKIKYLLLLSFIVILGLCTKSQAKITVNSPSVSSGGTVKITVNSQEGVASGSVSVSSNGGLTFVSASANGGVANGTKVAFALANNIKSGIATYTFKAPSVTTTKTYKIVFNSADMVTETGKSVASSTATATVTVKAKASTGTTTNTGTSGNTGTTTTTTAPKFTTVNETVYATSQVNVRASYSTSSAILGTLKKGDSVKRTGKSTSWSKVTYNGKTAYVSSQYLSTTKPKEESNNNKLKSLTVSPDKLTPTFSASVTNYTMTVDESVTEVEVDAVAEDSKATVTVKGNTGLKEGENTITIKVKAEDGTSKTYKIVVTKQEKVALGLKELLIEGLPLEPEFDSSVYNYTLKLDKNDVESLNITATPNDSSATVEIIGNTDLKVGENTITVLVKGDTEEESLTYQITVHIPEVVQTVENTNSDMELYMYAGLGVIGVIVIVVIFYGVKKLINRRNDDEYEEDEEYQENEKTIDEQEEIPESELEDLSHVEDDELPPSLRKKEKYDEEETHHERRKKLDEFYSQTEDDYMNNRRGKHF